MLLRLTNVRPLDLDQFDFDYDLSWVGLIVDASGGVYGRYGSRSAESAESDNTLDGLAHALRVALARHKAEQLPPAVKPFKQVHKTADYPEVKRLSDRACVHCHHVHDFDRQHRIRADVWKIADEWKYPPAQNLGLHLDRRRGDRVVDVGADSSAHRAGLRAGDVLLRVGGRPIASIADVRHALQYAPAAGALTVDYRRQQETRAAKLNLEDGWRRSDVSWRWSLRSLDPAPAWWGEDLDEEAKRKLGLPADRLAFRQAGFLTIPARQAGLKGGDVIIGLDGKDLRMNLRQFDAHVRLNYRVGQRIVLNVLRSGKRVDIPMKLVKRSQLH